MAAVVHSATQEKSLFLQCRQTVKRKFKELATRDSLEALPHELLYNVLDVALESDDRQLLERCMVAWPLQQVVFQQCDMRHKITPGTIRRMADTLIAHRRDCQHINLLDMSGVATDADATTALLRQMLAIDQNQLRSFFSIDTLARSRARLSYALATHRACRRPSLEDVQQLYSTELDSPRTLACVHACVNTSNYALFKRVMELCSARPEEGLAASVSVVSFSARNLFIHEIATLLPLMDPDLCASIDLAYNRLRDSDAVRITELLRTCTPGVVCLDLSHNYITNLDVLAPLLTSLTNMVSLSLGMNLRRNTPLLIPLDPMAHLAESLTPHASRTSASASHALEEDTRPPGQTYISTLAGMVHLRMLDLRGCLQSAAEVSLLATVLEESGAHLERLDIGGLKDLECPECLGRVLAVVAPSLSELRLDNSSLHSQHLAALSSALTMCKKLRKLNLAQNALDADAVPVLVDLLHNAWPELEELELTGNYLLRRTPDLSRFLLAVGRHGAMKSISIVGGAYYTLLPETQRTLREFKASNNHVAVDF